MTRGSWRHGCRRHGTAAHPGRVVVVGLAAPYFESGLLNRARERKRQRPRQAVFEAPVHRVQPSRSQLGILAPRQERDAWHCCGDGAHQVRYGGLSNLINADLVGRAQPRQHHILLQWHSFEQHALDVQLLEDLVQNLRTDFCAALKRVVARRQIDERIQTTAFNAEQALTRDTVPVNVDATIFWHVSDAEKAALAITNYREPIDRVAQTSLREMIALSMLAALLSDRKGPMRT